MNRIQKAGMLIDGILTQENRRAVYNHTLSEIQKEIFAQFDASYVNLKGPTYADGLRALRQEIEQHVGSAINARIEQETRVKLDRLFAIVGELVWGCDTD